MSEINYNIRPIQEEILKILKVFTAICEKHGIRFYAAYGTCLGAIRHHGFIPWDDDLDVFMPRPDYVKLIEIAKHELPNGYLWKSIETDPNYPYQFGKVCVADKHIVTEVSRASRLNLEGGLYIDVFPLDGFVSSEVCRLFWHIKRGLFRRGFTRWFGFIPCWYGKHDQTSRLQFQDWMSKHDYESSKMIASVSPYDAYLTPKRWVFPKIWFDDWKEMPFEDGSIRVPGGVLEMLNAIYGDYMKLPPEEQRIPSHQVFMEN